MFDPFIRTVDTVWKSLRLWLQLLMVGVSFVITIFIMEFFSFYDFFDGANVSLVRDILDSIVIYLIGLFLCIAILSLLLLIIHKYDKVTNR